MGTVTSIHLKTQLTEILQRPEQTFEEFDEKRHILRAAKGLIHDIGDTATLERRLHVSQPPKRIPGQSPSSDRASIPLVSSSASSKQPSPSEKGKDVIQEDGDQPQEQKNLTREQAPGRPPSSGRTSIVSITSLASSTSSKKSGSSEKARESGQEQEETTQEQTSAQSASSGGASILGIPLVSSQKIPITSGKENELVQKQEELDQGQRDLAQGRRELKQRQRELQQGQMELAEGQQGLALREQRIAEEEQRLASDRATFANERDLFNNRRDNLINETNRLNKALETCNNETARVRGELNVCTNERGTLAEERDRLKERIAQGTNTSAPENWDNERAELIKQRDSLNDQLNIRTDELALRTRERDHLQGIVDQGTNTSGPVNQDNVLDDLIKQRNSLDAQLKLRTHQRDTIAQERDTVTQERDPVTKKRAKVKETTEPVNFKNQRDTLTQQRYTLTQQRYIITQERDTITQERDTITQERDTITRERDTITQERDRLRLTIAQATKTSGPVKENNEESPQIRAQRQQELRNCQEERETLRITNSAQQQQLLTLQKTVQDGEQALADERRQYEEKEEKDIDEYNELMDDFNELNKLHGDNAKNSGCPLDGCTAVLTNEDGIVTVHVRLKLHYLYLVTDRH